jgi:hypothetical protein
MDLQEPAPRSAPSPPLHAVQPARADPIFLLVLTIFAVVALVATAPEFIDYDSLQFALALGQHDVRLHHPQPPGYVFTVWLARAATALSGNALQGLHLLALLFTAGAGAAVYALARDAYDRTTARWAAALFLFSPVVLFHAVVTKIYPADACTAAVVALLAWRAGRDPGWKSVAVVAGVIGLSGGVRPTSMLFALPLLLVVLAGRRRRDWWCAVIAGAAGTLAWLLPQLEPAGGLASYFELNRDLQSHIAAKSPLQRGGHALTQHLHRAAIVLLFGAGPARLAVLGWSLVRDRGRSRTHTAGLGRAIVLAWIALPLLFLSLYHFPKSGYALSLWPALSLGLARLARRHRALGIAVALDVGLFFAVPTMHICCRDAWELVEARRHPPATLVSWIPATWQRFDTWPPGAFRLGQIALGKVDFYFDRTRDFDFGGAMRALRAAGLPRADALLIGQHATRAACFELPEQFLVHADMNRPRPFVQYQNRRGTVLADTLRLPASTRWLWLEGDRGVLAFEPAPPPTIDLEVPLTRRFTLYDLGTGPLHLRYAPHVVAGGAPAHLWIVRGDPKP